MYKRNPTDEELRRDLSRLKFIYSSYCPDENKISMIESNKKVIYHSVQDKLFVEIFNHLSLVSQNNEVIKDIFNDNDSNIHLSIEEKLGFVISSVYPEMNKNESIRRINFCHKLLSHFNSSDTLLHMEVYTLHFRFFEHEIVEKQNEAVKHLKEARRIVDKIYPGFPFGVLDSDSSLKNISLLSLKWITETCDLYIHHLLGENEYYYNLQRKNKTCIKNNKEIEKYLKFAIPLCEKMSKSKKLLREKIDFLETHLYQLHSIYSRFFKFHHDFKNALKYGDMTLELKRRGLKMMIERKKKTIQGYPLEQSLIDILIINSRKRIEQQYKLFEDVYLFEKCKIVMTELENYEEAKIILQKIKKMLQDSNQLCVGSENACSYARLIFQYHQEVGGKSEEKIMKMLNRCIEIHIGTYGVDHTTVIDYHIVRCRLNLERNCFSLVRKDHP